MNDSLFQSQVFSSLRQRAIKILKTSKRKMNSSDSTMETVQLLHELQVRQIELELQNQELQESRTAAETALAHYTELYDFAIVGYYTFNCESIILKANLMAASFLQMERSDILGRSFVSFVASNEANIFIDFLKEVFASKQKRSCEVTLSSNDLSFRIVQIDASIFNDQECRVVAQDITENKRKERLAFQHQNELTQLARVKSMGELASAMAHEINRSHAVIANYVNGCMRRLESHDCKITEIVDIMRLVVKQVELANDIIHHMKDIVHQDRTFYKLHSINDIAKGAATQIQKEMHNHISVQLALDLADNLPSVNVNPLQIELVILNLLRNGLEAVCKAKTTMPKLILRTERQLKWIIVSVSNNGPHYSIDEETHLFDPGFTTKDGGMGMGLSISRTIVEAHSGYISFHKMSRTGVFFQFTLPINMKEYES